MGRLDHERALITGSTSGLGREIARLFAAEGATVVVTGRDPGRGAAVVDEIGRAGGQARFVPADLRDDEAIAALIAAADEWTGGLSVLVNNAVAAAGAHDGPVAALDSAAWHQILQVDLVAAATACRHAIPAMLRDGRGSIVNISSRAAARGTPGLAAYSAAKGGLEALARSITADYAASGIRCNTVRPGYVLHAQRDARLDDAGRARRAAMQLTRLATATDVAYAVAFLASREAECITGVTLPVDGGSSAVRGLTLG